MQTIQPTSPATLTRTLGLTLTLAALAALGGPASAALTTFTGSDDGASTAGPWANSAAAEAAFRAAAASIGTSTTIDFESVAVGYAANFSAAPGVSVALTGTNFGSGFTGISNTTLGNVYGFNTTSGGANWLGFPVGSATFTFDDPIAAFGFYLTGTQTVFGTAIRITFDDGTAQELMAPVNINGGASFFGFTDAGASISSIQISDATNDAWGIDDVIFTSAAAVPEPGTLLLAALAVGGLMRSSRSRKPA